MQRKRIFYGYWVLTAAFITLVVAHGLAGYSSSLYVKPLNGEFGWSRTQIMAGITLITLLMGGTAPLVGRLTHRYGAKRIIAVGAFVLGASFVLLSLTKALWQFYVLSTFVGVGFATVGVVPTSMVVSNWFKRRRGLAIGILGSGIGVGGFVMPIIVGAVLIPRFGWRVAYYVSGLLAVTLIIPLVLSVIKSKPEDMGLQPDGLEIPKPDIDVSTPSSGLERGMSLKMAMKTPAFWLMAVAFTTFGVANSAIFQSHVPHLQDIGFPSAAAAFAVSAVGIGSAIGKFGFGWLCDFIHPKYTLVIGSCLESTAVIILMNMKPTSPLPMSWLYAILFGLGVGSWLPAISMTTSTTFGLASYGAIFGVMNFLFMGAGASGPIVAGVIYDANQSYFWAFVMVLALHAIAVPTILLLRRPKMGKE